MAECKIGLVKCAHEIKLGRVLLSWPIWVEYTKVWKGNILVIPGSSDMSLRFSVYDALYFLDARVKICFGDIRDWVRQNRKGWGKGSQTNYWWPPVQSCSVHIKETRSQK